MAGLTAVVVFLNGFGFAGLGFQGFGLTGFEF